LTSSQTPSPEEKGLKSLSIGEGFRVRFNAENKKAQHDKVGLVGIDKMN